MLKELKLAQIGTVTRSSFMEKWGTPRQGGLTPDAIADLTFSKDPQLDVHPGDRVGIVWAAHLNSTAFNPLKAKIKPPKKMDGNRTIGVFATRGVHRPSSVGLSFCTVVKYTPGMMIVKGSDMIVDTPVLGVVPADKLGIVDMPAEKAGMPEWTKPAEIKLNWSFSAVASIQTIAKAKSMEVGVVMSHIKNILKQDPRSVHSVMKHVNPIYEVELDVGWVIYRHGHEGEIDVMFVTSERVVPEHKGRTEPWLTRLHEKLPFMN